MYLSMGNLVAGTDKLTISLLRASVILAFFILNCRPVQGIQVVNTFLLPSSIDSLVDQSLIQGTLLFPRPSIHLLISH